LPSSLYPTSTIPPSGYYNFTIVNFSAVSSLSLYETEISLFSIEKFKATARSLKLKSSEIVKSYFFNLSLALYKALSEPSIHNLYNCSLKLLLAALTLD